MITHAQLLAFQAREKRKDRIWRLVLLAFVAAFSMFLGALVSYLVVLVTGGFQ